MVGNNNPDKFKIHKNFDPYRLKFDITNEEQGFKSSNLEGEKTGQKFNSIGDALDLRQLPHNSDFIYGIMESPGYQDLSLRARREHHNASFIVAYLFPSLTEQAIADHENIDLPQNYDITQRFVDGVDDAYNTLSDRPGTSVLLIQEDGHHPVMYYPKKGPNFGQEFVAVETSSGYSITMSEPEFFHRLTTALGKEESFKAETELFYIQFNMN